MRLATRTLLATTALLGACATSGRQYGRDGLARVDHVVRENLVAGRYGSAYEAALGKDAHLRDRLLRALAVGTLGLYAARTDSSVWALDRAWSLAEDRWSKRLASAAASVAVNDYVLPYTPGPTERLFIPFYGALSWSARGDRDDAAVEARRLVQLLGEAAPDSTALAPGELRGLLHYVAGAVFEAAGDRPAADVAYRNAERLVSVPMSRDTSAADSLSGDVVVVLEQGFVGHPAPRELTVWVSRDELGALRSHGDERRLGTAGSVRAREGMFRYHPYYSRRGLDVGLTINWAEFRDGRDVAPSVMLAAHGAAQSVVGGGNVTRAVRADFERGQPARFTRALLRASGRAAIYKAAGDQLSKAGDNDRRRNPRSAERDERGERGDRGEGSIPAKPDMLEALKKEKEGKDDHDRTAVGRVLAGIGLFALAAAAEVNDPADLRSWNLLPHDLRVVRLRLGAGERDVRAVIDGEEILVGRAVVRAGEVTVLSQRLFRSPSRSPLVVSALSRRPE
jgi:hypothetical protein